ncbi:MAG: prepilin-type N-terminal cleavage/methylation domain-containing protein [Candidatus Omnitrophota bacterium]
MRQNRVSSGMTLAELLVAMFVIVLGMLSALLFFTNSIKAGEYARDITLATTHAEYILEEMRTTSYSDLVNGDYWSGWVQSEGLNTLPSESVVILVNAEDDPLAIETTVSWTRDGRTGNVGLTTQIANSTLP